MNSFIKGIVADIKKNYIIFFAEVFTFIIGIAIGIINYNNKEIIIFWGDNTKLICEYYFSIDANLIKLFFIRLFYNIVIILLVAVSSYKNYTVFVSFLLLIYRGIILGFAIKTFSTFYGLSGTICLVFVIIPQNLSVSFSIIVLSSSYYNKNCTKTDYLVRLSMFCFCIASLGAVYELIILGLIIKPTAIYF